MSTYKCCECEYETELLYNHNDSWVCSKCYINHISPQTQTITANELIHIDYENSKEERDAWSKRYAEHQEKIYKAHRKIVIDFVINFNWDREFSDREFNKYQSLFNCYGSWWELKNKVKWFKKKKMKLLIGRIRNNFILPRQIFDYPPMKTN